MKRLKAIILELLVLFLSSNLYGQESHSFGDIITFPDGSKGVVCYVDPNNSTKGWAVAANDLEDVYEIFLENTVPITSHNATPTQYNLSSWEFEGRANTLVLLNSGKSPAANAVDFYNGWYIPDIIQLRMILSFIPLIADSVSKIGGNLSGFYTIGYHHWSSSRYGSSGMYSLQGGEGGGYYGGQMATNTSSYMRVKKHIRPVRNFGDDVEAYWIDPYVSDSIKTGSMVVSPEVTTTYDAVVVFGTDTFPLTGTVVVHETYNADTLYEIVCQSDEPFTSNKSPLFTDLDISQVTNGYDTISRTTQTIHGCDSVITLLLKVVGDCEHLYHDSICPIVTQHDFAPFDTTFLPGTTSGIFEHHGVRVVDGVAIDTVAYYDLTIMPEYHFTDDLHLCLEEDTTVIPYSENEHVTITVTPGHITLSSDDASVVIDSTDNIHGNFVLRMTTDFGCDSLVTLHIDTAEVHYDTIYREDLFYLNTVECSDRSIGQEQVLSSYVPVCNYYQYSCSQQIFMSSEVGAAGLISTISFNYASTFPMTKKTDVKIYLAHTAKQTFTNTSDWTSPSDMTLVYVGDLNCTNQGWNEFVLNQPFEYNGSDNLMVMVLDESDDGDADAYFYQTNTSDNKCLYYNSSGSYWVPSSYGYFNWSRSDIRFHVCTSDSVAYTTELEGTTFTVQTPGTYIVRDTVAGSNGCDSIIIRILIVYPPHEDEICDSTFTEDQVWEDNVGPYCWHYNGGTYCIAGETVDSYGYYEFFGKDTIDGMEIDTTLYLKLTINPTYRDTTALDFCLYGNDTTITDTERDISIFINGDGSEISVTATNTENVTVERLLVGGEESTNDFVLRRKTVKGCDSIEVLHIATTIVARETLYKDVLFGPDAFTTRTVCVDTTIGTQSNTGSCFPLYNYYNYSCTQQIFTQEELGNAGTIEKISFKNILQLCRRQPYNAVEWCVHLFRSHHQVVIRQQHRLDISIGFDLSLPRSNELPFGLE